MHINETVTLSDGTKVVNFTGKTPDRLSIGHELYGCFGFIFNTLYIGDQHHAIIMSWLTDDQGHGWDEMMFTPEGEEQPQRWGWFTVDRRNGVLVDYRTDDAKQTQGLGDRVNGVFAEYYGLPAEYRSSEEGSTTQDNYGQRARTQYQGEYDEESQVYCDDCDRYYDPDEEYHSQEYCDFCGEYYCEFGQAYYHEAQDNYCDVCGDYYPDCVDGYQHGTNHDKCDYCDEYYNENDYDEEAKHENEDTWEYCYDCGEHYEANYEAEDHQFHHTTQTGLAYQELPAEKQNDLTKNYLQAAQSLYNLFLQQKTPDYGEGLVPVLPVLTPEQKTINALRNQYGMTEWVATDLVKQLQKNQMQLFSAWDEESDTIDRGIADVSDRIVFAKLAMLKFSEENDLVLDIEADPQSLEYRWSYDGKDLHIWQVTNRKLYGPSHYDMFGSIGYGEHSQGRVYVSPQGEVGSLYWQIAHPECETVINEWIQVNFNKQPDAVYHSYGQYAGEPRSRWDFPLVDVYSLPLKPHEKWWEVPGAHADSWYVEQGLVPPGRAKTKVKTYPASPTKSVAPSPEQRRKKKWQRNKNRKQKYHNRGRRRGAFTSPGDSYVQKFVIEKGQVKTAEPGNLYTAQVFHGDLYENGWGTLEDPIPGSGYLVLEPTTYGEYPLYEGDVFFFDHPTPQDVQLVKQHFGNIKRVRWPEIMLNEE